MVQHMSIRLDAVGRLRFERGCLLKSVLVMSPRAGLSRTSSAAALRTLA
jgi:hypothetical protein